MDFKKLKENLKWLDPFTYVDLYVMPKLNPQKSEVISTIVYLVFAFVFAFVLYNFFGFVLGTQAPLVIVVSGSMEPVMYRGDIVVISGAKLEELNVPQVELNNFDLDQTPLANYAMPVCVEKDSGRQESCENLLQQGTGPFETTAVKFSETQTVNIHKDGEILVYNSSLGQPVIHRSVVKIKGLDKTYVLTKGDSVFNPLIDQQAGITSGALTQDQIVGKAIFRVPLLGYIKLLLFDDLPALIFGCKNPQGCPFP